MVSSLSFVEEVLDKMIEWTDDWAGDEFREPPSIHDEMEKRLKMDW